MPSQLEPMDSSNIAGDWTQRTHDLAVDEPEPADSAWPNPADGLVEYSRRLDPANPWPGGQRTRTHGLAVDEPMALADPSEAN